ncbi:NADPH-dependent FMN reductase [Pseudomonas alcaligenes]|uniref:NADPH-dependent FMN reductase n=1 Tax=Aquipseudomonas alcaligenes TaxID=43263 RepID=A0ABR7RU97_AQUAC|nr:NAD(P)H-dependent oxidoreductase [Pseudomonas alcaligenes]MBC9248691.1 NADPH-dependent FMN reductase [Pseudomonas alcaligenes]
MSLNIVLVAGSSRSDSQTAKVAAYLAARLQQRDAQTQIIDLGRNALPLWPADAAHDHWPAMAEQLKGADALVVLSPEWNGMASPALKNFFLYAGRAELAHKPALLVGVSSGQGGAYPLSELRASSYKNCRICFIPEQLIVRQVEAVLNDVQAADGDDQRIRLRADWALEVLLEYAEALRGLPQRIDWSEPQFGNGM